MASPIPSADLKKIKKYWEDAVDTKADPNVQFLAAGRNFRLGLASAFKAMFHAAKAIFEVNKAVALGHIMPWDILGIAESTYHAVTNALNALSEAMSPLEYVACIVLGSKDAGLTAEQLKTEIESFLADPVERGKQAWYLGLTESRLSDAKDELDSTIPFDHLIEKLQKKKLVVQSGKKWKFTPRNIDCRIKLIE